MKKKKLTFDDDWMDITEEEFEASLDQGGFSDALRRGDKVTGTVISMNEKYVFLDIGQKSEGIIAVEEFVDETGALTIRPGDEIQATVTRSSDEILLSYRLRKKDQSREILMDAFQEGVPVEGKVSGRNKGGFTVNIGGYEAFCPISQMDTQFVDNPDEFVGQSLYFRIKKFENSGKNIVLSRAEILREEAEQEALKTLETIYPGMICDGTVTRLTDFGAFIDIGGLEGLAHISTLSWDRIGHPSEVLSTGQRVSVKILKLDREKRQISLSLKDASQNPWDLHVGVDIQLDGIYSGTVARIEKYGAFIKLFPGLDGLLHVSELQWGKSVRDPGEILHIGESVEVQVIGIDPEKRRISLSMKHLVDDPWEVFADILSTGKILEGTVLKAKSSGVEIELREHLTAFMPASMSGLPRARKVIQAFKPGEKITVRIAELNRMDRRIIVAAASDTSEEKTEDIQSYLDKVNQVPEEKQSVGSFGYLLSRALEKKKRGNTAEEKD